MATSNSFYCYVGDPVVTSATLTTPNSLPEELEYWTQNGVLDAIVSIAYIQNGDGSCKTRVGHVIVTNDGSSDRWVKITNSNGNTTVAHKVAKEDGYFSATYNWETTWAKGQSQSVVDKPVVITWYTNSACTSVDRTWTFHIRGTIGAKTTYTVRYDGNGSTGGSTAQQTKYYNESLALRTNGFTKTNYTFTSWNTIASGGGTSYGSASSGGTYTANSAVTLYAQWSQVYASPQLSITEAYRCDVDGVPDDEGAYAGIRCRFSIWDTGNNAVNTSPGNLPTCTVGSGSATASSGNPSTTKNTYSSTLTTSGNWKSGECWFVVSGNLQMENSYTATVTLKDTAGGVSGMSQNYVNKTVVITTAYYPIDILAGGHGICFGGVAKDEGFEVDFKDIRLHNAEMSTDTFFIAKNLNSNRIVAFGVGSGGANAGIWDANLSKWIIHSNGTNAVNLYDNGSGTYVNMLKQEAANANAFSIVSGTSTLVDASAIKFGRVVLVRVRYKLNANLSVPASGNVSNVTVGQIASGFRPAQWTGGYSVGDDAGAAWHSIAADGTVTLGACEGTGAARTINSGTTFVLTATYLTA